MASGVRRTLHFVFKVGKRAETMRFYREVLGMKALRHEEFEEGCKATCNGPYDGRWSKTMTGFGPEDDNFVVELTYNYGIKSYTKGNDFQYVLIQSKTAVANARRLNWYLQNIDNGVSVDAPGGYTFHLLDLDEPEDSDKVRSVSLSASNLTKSVEYWTELLGMKVYEQSHQAALLGYAEKQCKLQLIQVNEPVTHAEAFGRIAIACQESELPAVEAAVKAAGHTVLTPLVSLDTPGKASVQVVILADPDGHEICFVGDTGFRDLSQVDPKADELLDEAMKNDKSDEWFAKNAAAGEKN